MTIPLYEELTKSETDIINRLCEIDNDDFIIAPLENIYIDDDEILSFRAGLDDIMNFICAENILERYDGEECDIESFSCRLSIMQSVICDWLCRNISALEMFATITNRVQVKPLQNGAYKITSLSKIALSDGTRYISGNLTPAEMKKRKMLLAALAALRHERSAEIAYLKNDLAAFAIHFSYMWRSYARLATYPALHDGRALQEGRTKGGGRPTKDRKALKRLLEKFSPEYLNKEIPYRQIWKDVREGLGSDGRITSCCGSSFYFQPEVTSEDPTTGTLVEKKPRKEEDPLVFKNFTRVVGSLREAH